MNRTIRIEASTPIAFSLEAIRLGIPRQVAKAVLTAMLNDKDREAGDWSATLVIANPEELDPANLEILELSEQADEISEEEFELLVEMGEALSDSWLTREDFLFLEKMRGLANNNTAAAEAILAAFESRKVSVLFLAVFNIVVDTGHPARGTEAVLKGLGYID